MNVESEKNFINILNALKDEVFNLSRMDSNSKEFKILSETQLAYMHTQFVLQCKNKINLEVSEVLGRPAFFWGDYELVKWLKKKHTVKALPLYMRRIEILIELGYIKRIPFERLGPILSRVVPKDYYKSKPTLYVINHVDKEIFWDIDGYDIDFNEVNVKAIRESERNYKSQIKNGNKDSKKLKAKSISSKSSKEKLKGKDAMEQIKIKKLISEIKSYNLITLESEEIKEIFSVLTDYFFSTHLRYIYEDIVSHCIDSKYFLDYYYGGKPVLYIDRDKVGEIWQATSDVNVTFFKVIELLEHMNEICLIEIVSLKELSHEAQVSQTFIKEAILEDSHLNMKSKLHFFTLPRLNPKQLVKIHKELKKSIYFNEFKNNFISEARNQKNDSNIDVAKMSGRTERSYVINEKETNGLELLELVNDIMLESKTEGEFVKINQKLLDRLIKSVMNDV